MGQFQIQKVRIVSNNICCGSEPILEDEVEQHLTDNFGCMWHQ